MTDPTKPEDFKIDWKGVQFNDIEYGFFLISLYIDLIERNYSELIKTEKERIDANFEKDLTGNTEEDRWVHSTISSLYYLLDDGITPRFLAASAHIAIWGAYESAVHEIATYYAKNRGISLRLSDLKGSFVERAKRYFGSVLHFPLHPDGTDWPQLERLADLRHILAHANGRIQDVNDWAKAEKWISTTKGIQIVEDEYVVITFEFVRETYKFIEKLLFDLINRAPEDRNC